jgi:hypothetical protein
MIPKTLAFDLLRSLFLHHPQKSQLYKAYNSDPLGDAAAVAGVSLQPPPPPLPQESSIA